MKILHIINDLSKNGGAQRFLIDLVSHNDPHFEIKVLILSDENEYQAELKECGVEYLSWKSLTFQQKWNLLRWPDLVHGHLYPSIYLALLAIGKKKLQTEHNTTNRRRDYPMLKFMEYWLYKSFDMTICITGRVQEELIRFMPRYQSKYSVVYNGVELGKFTMQPKIRSAFAKDKVFKIGMAGRLHNYKDHESLLRAMQSLPQNYELHLAGGGPKQEELQALATSLGIEQRVHWYGVISDIPNFLNSLDVYVQSSLVEGFGLASVEAMASGLPVLGSDVPGLDEVIGDSRYLFPTGSPTLLADKILTITNDIDTYNEASRYSVERASLYTIDKFREGYYAAYAQLCPEK
ncbi:glycosyltransferase [Vibrio rotiferianus]|uniref:glycosyltransferase n=1 Tax=Vibrio rotiferianus TaxID=190895 RepID=UPI00390A4CC4